MSGKSSVSRQPAEVREAIGIWRREGKTLDAILDALDAEFEVKISRSALGRHVKGLDKTLERLERSKQVAEATVARFGREPENKLVRANIEIMHSVINDMLASDDGEAGAGVVSGAQDAMLMAKAMDHLAKAERNNAELIGKIREQARKEVEAEMQARVKSLGTAKDLKALTDAELERAIAGLAGA
jgi:hypothetical protein